MVDAAEGDADVVGVPLPFRAPQPPTTTARRPTASPRATMLGIGLRHRFESEREMAGVRPIQWVLPISGSPFPRVDLPCTGDRTEEDAPGRGHVVPGEPSPSPVSARLAEVPPEAASMDGDYPMGGWPSWARRLLTAPRAIDRGRMPLTPPDSMLMSVGIRKRAQSLATSVAWIQASR